ncbi:MAG TPA: hypothetical protein VFT59_05480, partial [Candidatus Saccharimonadales bacterium]|nr:hypothetical protein [Candidatus Saccharimonadales bacterium]
MSEKAPKTTHEQSFAETEFAEGLPSRDEAIDRVRNEMNSIQSELDEAKARAETPGFKASANDLIDAKLGYRDLKAEKEPRLEAVQSLWLENGGAEIEAAEKAMSELNFRSDANERVAAQTRLRDAKNAFYENLKVALLEGEANKTRTHDVDEAYDEAESMNQDRNKAEDSDLDPIEDDNFDDLEDHETDPKNEEDGDKDKDPSDLDPIEDDDFDD